MHGSRLQPAVSLLLPEPFGYRLADRPDAFVAVRLIDLAPDGSAALVARGFLNLAHRESREEPSPLVPGKRYQVKVQLNGMAYAFPQGHRMMLAISNAYWPLIWPSPEPVVLTVYSGISQLLLPLRQPQPSDAELPPVPEPVVPPPSPMTSLGVGRRERLVTIDHLAGGVSYRVLGGWGKLRLDEIDLEVGHVYQRTHSISPDDPNSARFSMTQRYELSRGDWQIVLNAQTEVTSSAKDFELDAWLEAFDADGLVSRREWKASVPRNRM